MRLKFEHFDGRRRVWRDIIDEDTGQQVGTIRTEGVGFSGYGGIEISLFGGKYQHTATRYEECWGFVKGVESVLRHVIGTNPSVIYVKDTAAA
jgi:hypothetical protein